MKSVFLKFQPKKRLLMGVAVTVAVLSVGVGGYAFAVTAGVTTSTNASDTETLTATVPYTAVLGAPSDGHGGYLVDIADFPANARITSVDMLVHTPYTTSENSGVTGKLNLSDPSDSPSSVTYLIMNDITDGPSGSNHTSFWVTPSMGINEQSTGAIIPDSGVLQLDVDRWGGSFDPGETLTAGEVTVYVNYIQY
ncbi:MAG TPA: hypothetical protein VLG92_05805 [Candidatus Saccharimonadia bacterium]|nr:hypothetical protein [Candidatus Saccharimonadia bacterium]